MSFYTLPSTVMHHPVHKTLKAAYAFYNVSTRTPWIELMQDALVVAKNVSICYLFFFLVTAAVLTGYNCTLSTAVCSLLVPHL